MTARRALTRYGGRTRLVAAADALDIVRAVADFLVERLSASGGGRVNLEVGTSATISATNRKLSVDSYLDQFRVYESGATARGFSVDIAACAAGAATKLFHTENVSAFIQTLLDDANQAAALTTLGAQPAFTVGSWTNLTLINSWANSINTTRVRRIGPFAELQISITGGTANTEAFTLPAGFRPVTEFNGNCLGSTLAGAFTVANYNVSNFRYSPTTTGFYGTVLIYCG